MRKARSMDVVLTLVLFCVFTASVLMVLMSGVQSYQRVAESMQQSYEERVCLQYITSKLRHYSGSEQVAVSTFGGSDCLELWEEIEGVRYVTCIYLYNGMVKELFCEEGAELSPDSGFDVMQAQALTIQMVAPGLVQVVCTGASGGSAEAFIAIRGEGGEPA